MRIVFCGSGDVAAVTLEAVHGAGCDIPLVITQPPRKAGRGGKLTSTPVSDRGGALGLAVVACRSINDPEYVQIVGQLAPDALVVVDFGQKIGPDLREIPPHGAFNMHASLLPALRGAAPINWAIIRGHSHTGVTTFALVDKMDAGAILLQASLEIDRADTAADLRARLAALGAETVLKTLDGLAAGTIEPRLQDESQITIAPKLAKADGRIDFAQSGLAIVNRIRGTWPWPGAFCDFLHAGGKRSRVIFVNARALLTGEPNPAGAGTVAEDLSINVHDGAVEVLELKVAGKRVMAWKDFVNGYRVAPGDRFVTAGEGVQ